MWSGSGGSVFGNELIVPFGTLEMIHVALVAFAPTQF